MTIALQDIWPIEKEKQGDYKVHFARRSGEHPLDVWARDRNDWVGWQQYRPPKRNEFNRRFIFSLMQFYHETDTWLFGGVFRVLVRHQDGYELVLTDQGCPFIGRLKLYTAYRSRPRRLNMEGQYDKFEVREILREPYAGRPFPGYAHINLSFGELETNHTKRTERLAGGTGERERYLSHYR